MPSPLFLFPDFGPVHVPPRAGQENPCWGRSGISCSGDPVLVFEPEVLDAIRAWHRSWDGCWRIGEFDRVSQSATGEMSSGGSQCHPRSAGLFPRDIKKNDDGRTAEEDDDESLLGFWSEIRNMQDSWPAPVGSHCDP